MSIFDKECPSDPYDARREGERSRSYEHNPYEHGKYGEYDCRRAYEEWERGHDNAARERREQEEAMEREAQRRDFERAEYARSEEEERLQYEAMEAEQMRYAEQDIQEAEQVTEAETAPVEVDRGDSERSPE